MSYGVSYRGVGTKTQGRDQLPSDYSSSSEHRKSLFYVKWLVPTLYPLRFPGEREISNTHAIPSTPSAWTLKVPEVHKRNTQDVDEHTSEQCMSNFVVSVPYLTIQKLDPPKQDKQDVNGPPTGGAKDVPGDRLDSSPGLC